MGDTLQRVYNWPALQVMATRPFPIASSRASPYGTGLL
jgi:hypothetical protein